MGESRSRTAAIAGLLLGYATTYQAIPEVSVDDATATLQRALNIANELRRHGPTLLGQDSPEAAKELCQLITTLASDSMSLWLIIMQRRIQPIVEGNLDPETKVDQLIEIIEPELSAMGVDLVAFRRGRGISLRVELRRTLVG